MTSIAGTNIASRIAPFDSADTYATHDAQWGRDGFRSVANTTERDLISTQRRKEGMLVYCVSGDTTYQLFGGTSNSNWKTFNSESSGPVGAVGDGITDDTVAIQNAINDTTNKIILFPGNKTYLISDTLFISNPEIQIIGANIKMSSTPVSGSYLKDYSMVFSVSADNCLLDSVNIVGPDSTTQYSVYDYSSAAIEIQHGTGNEVKNCNINITGFCVNGISNRLTTNHTRITNNVLNGCGIAFARSGAQNTICDGNRITNCYENGLSGVGDNDTTQRNNVVSNNYLENIGRMGIEDIQNTHATKIIGNYIKNCGILNPGEGFGISSVGISGATLVSKNTIINYSEYGIECPSINFNLISENIISQDSSGNQYTGIGIMVIGGGSQLIIKNNTISKPNYGLSLINDFNNVIVEDNHISNCRECAIAADTQSDATLIIRGNMFRYDVPNNMPDNEVRTCISTYATDNSGFKQTIIQGNHFHYLPSAGGGSSSGVEFTIRPSSDNCSITENMFDGGNLQNPPILTGYGATNTGMKIVGNTFINNAGYYTDSFTNPYVALNNIDPIDGLINVSVGFFDKQASMAPQPVVVGTKSSNSALNSLLTGLSSLGLVNDTTTIDDNVVKTAKDYGAIGDGVADDTAALQTAIYNSNTLFIPKGNYKITQSLEISGSNIKIFGEKGSKIYSDNTDNLMYFGKDITGARISSLSLVSNLSGAGYSYALFESFHTNVDNVVFDDMDFSIPKCVVNGMMIVCEASGKYVKDLTISNSRFTNIGRMGVEIQNHAEDMKPRLFNVKLLNNSFKNIGIYSFPDGNGMGLSVSGSGSGTVIDKNYFENTLLYALEVVDSSNSIVTNNWGYYFPRATAGISYTADEDYYNRNVIIRGNNFIGLSDNNNFYNIINGVIDGNILKVDNLDVMARQIEADVSARGSRFYTFDSTITNNIFVSVTGTFAVFDESSHALFSGNLFENTPSTMLYGNLVVGSYAYQNVFINNKVITNYESGNWISDYNTGNGNVYKDNYAEDNRNISALVSDYAQGITPLPNSNTTLTSIDSCCDYLPFTGTLSAVRNVLVQPIVKQWIIKNSCSRAIRFGYATGGLVVGISAGVTNVVFGDGVDMRMVK